ncbi:hypothetical protein HK099_008540 [Clydaea vesicula]|uniref:Aminotransferase class I/classII large domain-containing protein n=1 Tax=Clydaea vesicula TaxID=447962 RepID=A0AAD5U4V3_9FUNG|nr:hypothetical protein HK099_008540 [Clydaea vesicula]
MDSSRELRLSLKNKLKLRNDRSMLRILKSNTHLADFSSNDYLGLAKNESLMNNIKLASANILQNGSTGSRLLTGHSQHAEDLEFFLAQFHKSEDALLFNSGFDANYGLFSCIMTEKDGIIYDELIHASVHEGMRASKSKYQKSFQHNDVESLITQIQEFKKINNDGHLFIAVESIYSMDGHVSKLEEMINAVKNYKNCHFIVDEAHSTGILGPQGRGLVSELKLESQVLARVHTFGKALGSHGEKFRGSLCDLPNGILLESDTPIQGVLVPERYQLDVRPIRSPTVPKGEERIRICLHSHNTDSEIDLLTNSIKTLILNSYVSNTNAISARL